MNIFFSQKYRYSVYDSVDHVKKDFKAITGRRWYDFSKNISGRLRSDGSFKLTHKWSFANFQWIENSPAYITGTITADGNGTIIDTTLRPNSVFVIFFYLMVFLLLCEIVGINTVDAPKIFRLLFFPIFGLILFALMKIFTAGLRKRFERMLNLRPA